MKRIVNAHLTIPIEVDENGTINLLNEYTQTYITAFSGELKPRDNMYQKIMDFLKQPADPVAEDPVAAEDPVTNSVTNPVADPVAEDPVTEDPVCMVLKKSGLKVRKPSESQTFKNYGKNKGSTQWTRRVK